MRNKKIGIFVLGFMLTILIMPLLSKVGIPSYDLFLTAVFGERNVWALVFTGILLVLFLVGMRKWEKTSK